MGNMERLTETVQYPLDTFNRCQLCGKTSDDICAFRMWYECDIHDVPDPYRMLVTCQSEPCLALIENHPRLYKEVPWSRGGPGRFMLLCGDCPSRMGTLCTEPRLKSNGGKGLAVTFSRPPWQGFICWESGCSPLGSTAANSCEGHPTRKPKT